MHKIVKGFLLQTHAIPVVQDLPGVGSNMQDHLEIYIQQKCKEPITLYDRSSWRFPHTMIKTGLQWFANQTGDGASSHLESGGFCRRNDQVLLCFTTVQYRVHFLSNLFDEQETRLSIEI